MDDLVSVIVPVYNVKDYICDCIDSIINQKYKNMEIILSDDGSTDGCGEICDKYAQKDNRIKVIHDKNMGLSEARNRGIRIGQGRYITFVDSDDVLDDGFVYNLVKAANSYDADIAVAGYCTFHTVSDINMIVKQRENDIQNDIEILSEKHLYDKEFLKRETTCLTVAWGKVYKRTLFEAIEYPVSKLHEDTFTTYKLMYKARKVVYLKNKLYYWRENPDSITRGAFRTEHFDILDAYAEQIDFFREKKEQRYVEIVFESYLENFFWCYNRMREAHIETKLLKPYEEYMKRHIGYIKLTKSLGIRQWIRYKYLVWYKIPKIVGHVWRM